ncbi:LptM family lipoprotein [Paenibacillus sp. An7]|uniref:LptM family lipoprotein n=1 Tax=Paenibacillus sp. An7 TaxID=2689577 RepID=UPI00135C9354|nr:hypothetical protein [Paenibacillus sp. An7]
MKKLLLLVICSLTLLTACSQKADLYESQLTEEKLKFTEEINEKEENIEQLKQKISQLNVQINDLNKEREDIISISNISMDFIKAQTTGDYSTLQGLLPEKFSLIEKDNELLLIDENDIDNSIFDKEKTLIGLEYRGYHYDSKDNTYILFIAEYYEYNEDVDVEFKEFLQVVNLEFIDNGGRWQIESFDFDI